MTFTYDESYYTKANYAGYLEREERYDRMVQEIENELFRVLKLDFKKSPVIDYGCGVGFVVNALSRLDYEDVCGFDVSEWALQYAKSKYSYKGCWFTSSKSALEFRDFELMTAFDVFEHMPAHEISEVLRLADPRHLLVRIPLAEVDDGKFYLNVSENDPTHITRMTRNSWNNFLSFCGYSRLFYVNLGTFYDTQGVMCAMFRRSNR